MSGSDVKSKRVTATGALSVGRSRLRMLVVTTTATAGRLTMTDGNGGATLLDVDLVASNTHNFYIPEEGVLFTSDLYVSTLTNITSVTAFYS
ncbi:hypothetical protein UFOVP1202_73 [uncultured Caudovirales phage]|uniref:Uncharacterized protein n=1 Tax=uncultured Caudovirales phage TaxID=2100421 RepID=A0A6J5RG07_9CAUD|nr:hypothetical protein UFOVP1202_73 [uncultured Caudovirales phage]